MSAKKDVKAAGKSGARAAAKKPAKKKPAAKKPAKKEAVNGKVTHVVIVLDRSGSMEEVRDETISGFNEQIGKIRAKAMESGAKETFVTLVLFNDEVVFSRFAEPAETLGPIDREIYAPDRTTAMLDAVGLTLERFQKVVQDDGGTRYLMVVISDGLENDSKIHTYESVAELIQQRRSTGRWTFSYMGANQDLGVVARRMAIPRSNISAYNSDAKGTALSFRRLSGSMMGFIDRRARGESADQGFFRERDEIGAVEDEEDPGSKPN